MASNDCLGIIHRNVPSEVQADMVRSVKRRGLHNCRVRNPATFRVTDTLTYDEQGTRIYVYIFPHPGCR